MTRAILALALVLLQSATRLPQNPLITVDSSPTLGDNVNGPSIIRVPSWIPQPRGRYYGYFAHHKGQFIRLAYSDAIAGPWKIYEAGVVQVKDTAFYRPQPDPPGSPAELYTHVASPEIYVDEARHKLVMWFHGWWTDGQRWPLDGPAARAWVREHRYAQFTQVAESSDGIHFDIHAPITHTSYLRVFPYDGMYYGMARLGLLLRSADPLKAFEVGPNPFRDGPYSGRVRHVALLRRDRRLFVFFSGIGDAPERILLSTIDLTGDWRQWKASAPTEILRPQAPYECPQIRAAPSEPGEIYGKAQQLRDPAIFEENGKTFLFYSICGEQGLGAAEITVPTS